MKCISLIVLFLFLLSACSDKTPKESESTFITSYEIRIADTCNRIDNKGRKQGKWYNYRGSPLNVTDTAFYKDGVKQ